MKITVSDEIVDKIKAENSNPSPEKFQEIYLSVHDNLVLADILGIDAEDLEIKKMKLTYAKIVLDPEKYAAIGEEFIMDPNMTLDSLNHIGEYMSIEIVVAMTGKHLAHKNMNIDSEKKMGSGKIIDLSFNGSADHVRDIGAENIAQMSDKELSKILEEDFKAKRSVLIDAREWLFGEIEGGSIEKDTGTNITIEGYEFEIHILRIDEDSMSFGLFLPEQIYSRKTIGISKRGFGEQIPKITTREGVVEEFEGEMIQKGNTKRYIPLSDVVENEPDFSMIDKEYARRVMEELRTSH